MFSYNYIGVTLEGKLGDFFKVGKKSGQNSQNLHQTPVLTSASSVVSSIGPVESSAQLLGQDIQV